jgi:hypothetical protein
MDTNNNDHAPPWHTCRDTLKAHLQIISFVKNGTKSLDLASSWLEYWLLELRSNRHIIITYFVNDTVNERCHTRWWTKNLFLQNVIYWIINQMVVGLHVIPYGPYTSCIYLYGNFKNPSKSHLMSFPYHTFHLYI